MKIFLLKMLLETLAVWTWSSYQESSFIEEYETPENREANQTSSDWSRSLFSEFVVTGVDCMDNGSYDEYIKNHVNQENLKSEPEPQTRDDGFPSFYFKFMGLDTTDYYTKTGQGKEHYFNKAFCSDLFYMEYPSDWYVGTADSSGLAFVPEWEEEESGRFIQDWVDYSDKHLEGDKDKVREYIEGGGINAYLEEVIGKPVTSEYKLDCREQDSDSDWLLMYDLNRDDKVAAQIVIWCNLGKASARSRDIQLTVDPKEDYGRILVFQEWEDIDFSSAETIGEYIESDDFRLRLLEDALEDDLRQKSVSVDRGTFTTPYHEFLCADVSVWDAGNTEKMIRQAAVYIPVAEPYHKNWVVVFETFPGSEREENVYNSQVREHIMETFVSLPYYHEVEQGENLSFIARQYGDDPNLAYEIADYGTNHLKDPNRIYPGQKIEIPLGVLFRKVHH